MSEDTGIINKLAENYILKFVARLVIPPLMTVTIGISGWLIADKLTGISETQKTFWGAISEIRKSNTEVSKTISEMTSSFKSHIKEDDLFDGTTNHTLADHEMRVRNIEIMQAAGASRNSPR